MTIITAISNQKGGVAKTTTCVNLAASLSIGYKKKILVIDLDPQANATMGSGVNKNTLTLSNYDLFCHKVKIKEVLLRNTPAGYDLLPANNDLTAATVHLTRMDQSQQILKQTLAEMKNAYDAIIIDCPPALNMLTLNALTAADNLVIPMQCEYYALEGLTDLLDTIENVKARINPNLYIDGLLRAMCDMRNSLTKQVSDQLIAYFGSQVYQTIIPRNVRLAEAPSHGLPIIRYDKSSIGNKAYVNFAREYKKRHLV